MKKLAIAIALVIGILYSSMPQPAEAGSSTDIALGLASFAVFNQLFGGLVYQPRYHVVRYHVVEPASVVYVPRPVYVTQSVAAVQPSVIHYPHGRYELYGGSQWVWIPNLPAPPPAAMPCKLTGKYVKTPSGFQPECE